MSRFSSIDGTQPMSGNPGTTPRREVAIFTPYGFPTPDPVYLEATKYLNFNVSSVRNFALDAIGNADSLTEKAVRLFYAVRDGILYDPYAIRFSPAYFKASAVLAAGRGFCIPKAVLLAAAARFVGIPSAIGLSDVMNHFTSAKLKAFMGQKEVFLHHGSVAMYLEGRWLKAVPAFNRQLCSHLNVPPTEFDGYSDALLQQLDNKGEKRTAYIRDHGFWSDLPYARIRDDFLGYYPTGLKAHVRVTDDAAFSVR